MERKVLTREELISYATKSSFAIKSKIDNSLNPAALSSNVEYLYNKVLLPLQEYFGTNLNITSWYRCPKLNNAVGGSGSSFHVYAAAIDIDMDGTSIKNEFIFNYIKEHLPFTELINEYDFSWVHVALIKGRDNEKVIKKIYNKGAKKVTEIIS